MQSAALAHGAATPGAERTCYRILTARGAAQKNRRRSCRAKVLRTKPAAVRTGVLASVRQVGDLLTAVR